MTTRKRKPAAAMPPEGAIGGDAKACTKCGAVKPLGEFHNDPRRRDGRRSNCKECQNASVAAWDAANRERVRAYFATWYASNRQQRLATMAVWRDANRERAHAATAAWKAANPEQAKAAYRAWYDANPDKCRENEARRRARKANAPVVERVYRAKVWARDGGRCHICGALADPDNWHLDHVTPLARGGEHSYRNVAVSHPACNLRKGVSLPLAMTGSPE